MLKPLEDRVLLKIIENEKTTKSGIILNEDNEISIKFAEVIEVGNGKIVNEKEITMQVKKGDKVVINKFAGTEIKYNDEDFIIVKYEEILAIIS